MARPQFQSTMLSAYFQDLQRQLQLLIKDFQRQLLQLRQQLQDREEVISQLQHQFIQVQEEVQGNSQGQLLLEHAVRTCQRQQGQQRAQPSTSPPLRHTPQTLTQPATQTPAQPQPPVQLPVQPQPPVQPSAQPSAQNTVQRAAQPPRHQSELTALIPSWARLEQPVQQPPIDIEEAPGSDMVLPEEHERRKRSANVVMYGLSGESSACLKQAAEEVFQALNLPHAGQHGLQWSPCLPRVPTPLWWCVLMTLTGAHACCAPSVACCGSLHLPGCTLLSISPGSNRLRKLQGSPGLMQLDSWAVPSGGAVMSCCTAERPPLALP